ncbi:ornithine carbamoyltransferase [Roseateles saccharophilus]|uniref:Ornithine carbamoyltransferase n=2 Tax=Roseateles saccharophilus TaxID=304 RepID=A0A4R3UJN0_ROSSA|nr:ornithine carbamoyltransferase [Roseateles saccharophilus]TCU90671.1 ornithine carbamoyltransferase [Roseateles saccharophilus]
MPADFSGPQDAAALVLQARALAGAGEAARQLLNGKNLALLSPSKDDQSASEFVQAAAALGAHVSLVQPGLDARSSARQVEDTARMLGRLYDAVECQHLPAALVQRIARSAGIPVFAGLATAAHPTTALAAELDGDASPADKRRRILQAALIVSMA